MNRCSPPAMKRLLWRLLRLANKVGQASSLSLFHFQGIFTVEGRLVRRGFSFSGGGNLPPPASPRFRFAAPVRHGASDGGFSLSAFPHYVKEPPDGLPPSLHPG